MRNHVFAVDILYIVFILNEHVYDYMLTTTKIFNKVFTYTATKILQNVTTPQIPEWNQTALNNTSKHKFAEALNNGVMGLSVVR
jgi:hypothetical protein